MSFSPTFVVYVDESGDEGFAFGRGSSEWLVISAAIVRKAMELDTVKLVDRVRALLGKPEKKPLHFRDLRHEQRLPFLAEISKARLRSVSVLVHKPSLREPEKFHERYRLYFYAVRYLLERVSWYCREHKTAGDAGDGTAEIIFSNRSGMAYEEMRAYLDLLAKQTDFLDVRVDWRVVKPELISAYTPGRRMGLQVADAIATSAYYAVQVSRYGFVEDRYIRMLKPVVYHHQGRYLGYGLKFWPREVMEMIPTRPQFRWVQESFQ